MNKSLLLSIIPYLFPIGVICEEDFLFSLLFTDSLGNSNEIYLGYDKDATDSVDTIYGENDVSSMALNPELDIRISQDTIGDLDESISFPSFQSKKQVLKNRCSENSAMVFRIDIHAKYWPLEVTWDPLKFNEECRAASGFTNTRKGALGDGWLFSTLGWQELNSTGRLQFNANSNVNPNWKGDKRVSYVFENDTVPVFWVWLLKTPPSSVEDIWKSKPKYHIFRSNGEES